MSEYSGHRYSRKMSSRSYLRNGAAVPVHSDSDENSSRSGRYSSESRSRSRSRSRSPYRLHIADIGDEVSKGDIEKLFGGFGALQEIWMANCPPCFGFAVFKRKTDAMAARDGTDGLLVGGSRIRVSFARPRTRGLGRRPYNPHLRCYQCGNSGHFSRNCPDLDKGYRRSRRHDYDSEHEYSERSRRSHGARSRRYSGDRSPDCGRRHRR